MERLRSVAWLGQVGRFAPTQAIPQRRSWGVIPDDQMSLAAARTINMVPATRKVVQANGVAREVPYTTVTVINPLDPGDGPDCNWYEPPYTPSRVIPAGKGYR